MAVYPCEIFIRISSYGVYWHLLHIFMTNRIYGQFSAREFAYLRYLCICSGNTYFCFIVACWQLHAAQNIYEDVHWKLAILYLHEPHSLLGFDEWGELIYWNKWNEWCFRPRFCTVMLYWARQPGQMRWILLWIMPLVQDWSLTCWPAVQCTITVPQMPPIS